jgi:hypothetical protein
MQGGLLAFIIVIPIAGILGIYRFLTNGNQPCLKTENIDNHNKIYLES